MPKCCSCNCQLHIPRSISCQNSWYDFYHRTNHSSLWQELIRCLTSCFSLAAHILFRCCMSVLLCSVSLLRWANIELIYNNANILFFDVYLISSQQLNYLLLFLLSFVVFLLFYGCYHWMRWWSLFTCTSIAWYLKSLTESFPIDCPWCLMSHQSALYSHSFCFCCWYLCSAV